MSAATVSQSYSDLVARLRGAAGPPGGTAPIRIQVGSATCEHAAGSRAVLQEFQRHLASSGRTDVVLHETGCTGRCSREPIVGVFVPGKLPVKYEKVDRDLAHAIFTSHVLGGTPLWDHVLDAPGEQTAQFELLFCGSAACGRERGEQLRADLTKLLADRGIPPDRVRVSSANCVGACKPEEVGHLVHLLVRPARVLYRLTNTEDLAEVVDQHLLGGKVVERLLSTEEPLNRRFLDLYGDVAFFNRQTRIALRNNGVLDPESIAEYVRYGGFSALAKVLEQGDREWIVGEVTRAKLRGRGGGGYPTGQKWSMVARATAEPKYLICNADEGDPGAFMDRSMLESDPLNVIEGMLIAGYAIGAQRGFFYVRAEYPLAIQRIEHALAQCREYGLLGESILGSDFRFDLEIRLGAGAFVCGEETSLIHSIEGERGQPRIRPPYPAERGLWGQPTVINNVETFANIPVIIGYGGDWFGRIGTERSGGTKVFALAGKVRHTGLVEVPMGTTLREVVFEIGGGVPGGKRLKAIQTGGPAGGCLPESWLDTPVDFDTLTQAGSIMGSGGMIILDEDDCMVDVAKFFMAFSQDESCGKCTPCREGTKRVLEILECITTGSGTLEDLDKLERLGRLMRKASLCGLGRAAANPVLSTLRHFRDEYLAHVQDRTCPARKCAALVRYEIDPDRCTGCTVCARNCPVAAISGERRQAHTIDQTRCTKCGRCSEVCRFNAVQKL